MSCCCASGPEESLPASNTWLKLGIAILLSGLSMFLSLGVNISEPQGTARTAIHAFLAALSLVAMAVLGREMFAEGWRRAKARSITLEHAFLIGICGAFAASTIASITGRGAVYYEVVIVLIAIYYFGKTITEQQITKQRDLAGSIPGLISRATITEDGRQSEVDSREVRKGQTVRVRSGETIPVDARITSGTSYVEQHAHTGETYPKVVSAGDTILAGGRVLDGEITATALTSGTDREIDRLNESLSSDFIQDTKTGALAQAILDRFVPIVLGVALLTGIVWTILGHADVAWQHALTVTVVACPCALGVAIPLAIRRGINSLRGLGIITKNSGFIDRLDNVTTVAFDKTGTLSNSTLELRSFEVTDDAPAQLKEWVIAVQKQSSHPVARPFWKLGEPEATVSRDIFIETIPGRGIRAMIDGEQLLIGNRFLVEDENLAATEARAIYVIHKGSVVATALLEERSKEGSVATIRALTEIGFKVLLLTGDSTIPSEYRIPGVGCHAGLTSGEKAAYLREASKTSSVLYIGDGLNDCEGFSEADCSIALESGNPAAKQVAGATLLHDDLSVIPEALNSIKKTGQNLHKILLFSFVYNTCGIALAALGILHPIVAAILMFASSIYVVGRLGRSPVTA